MAYAAPGVMMVAAIVAFINVFDENDSNEGLYWGLWGGLMALGFLMAIVGNIGWRRETRKKIAKIEQEFDESFKRFRENGYRGYLD
jgi:hypothetical protein